MSEFKEQEGKFADVLEKAKEGKPITPQQEAAVSSRGRVIVSASAGSGKTFVMIERLVRLILGGEHVLGMLAVTFTNKAAAQMRDRLRTALLAAISSSRGEVRERLTKELSDLPLMDISTIHAFCGRLVRTHFYLTGVDPAFTVLAEDSPVGKQLSKCAMDEVFEAAYAENSPQFRLALSALFRGHKDGELRRAVKQIYADAHKSADLEGTLSRIGENMFERASEDLAARFRSCAMRALDWMDERGAFFAEKFPAALKLLGMLSEILEAIAAGGTLYETADRVKAIPFRRINRPSVEKMSEEVRAASDELAALRRWTKETYDDLTSLGTEEEERKKAEKASELAAALGTLAKAYGEAYGRLKRENGVLDYDDLERYALTVLGDEEVRREVLSRYRFVCVDEYQDVNPVQERILGALSGEEVFLVGDAKQAIYGFRGSRSVYFGEKERAFGFSLRLTRNFRSSEAVLGAVNTVFAPVFGPTYVPVEGGDRFDGHRGAVTFRFADEEEKVTPERGIYSVLTGSVATKRNPVAEKIASIVEHELGSLWYDADEKDPARRIKRVEYRDIAVLVRTHEGDAKAVSEALSARGIPVSASERVDLLGTFEARLMLNILSFLDNAEQDIPLTAALLSLGGFTDAELSRIRLAAPSAPTFRKACARVREGEGELSRRLELFFRETERLRALARIKTAAEMGELLLSQGLEPLIASKGDGKARLSRVRRLLAEGEGCNVHTFLARMQSAGRLEVTEEGGGNTVRVLTMHAAKGLEFPVVILGSLSAPFSRDRDYPTFWSDEYLVAPYDYDSETGTYGETVVRRAAAVSRKREKIEGERNLLYVAMTRARYRLHLVFSGKGHTSAYMPESAGHLEDFIDFHACAPLFVGEEEENPPLPHAPVVSTESEERASRIAEVFAVPYPYAESVALPSKTSATSLMRETETAHLSSRRAGKTAEEGIAYHAFLEHVEFGKPAGEELARMRAEGVFTPQQIEVLREEELVRILEIPCLKHAAGKQIRREQKFLISLPACEFTDTAARDEVLIQGAIDLLIKDEEGFLIVDYKYSSRGDEELRAAYGLQISLYRKAVAKVMRVDESKIRARIVNIFACREIPM